MDINVSYACSDKIKDEIEFQEEFLVNVINDIFCYILETDLVKNNLAIYDSIKHNYEIIEISLYLCDNEEIQSLNLKYREKNSPTDVLTFTMSVDENIIDLPILHLGEIVISIEKLREQARENNHENVKELLFLISHGLLHLLGAHHDSMETYKKVVSLQDKVVEYIISR
jgi:probable rRNA maturation factor